MFKYLLIIFSLFSFTSHAQQKPVEGAKLNYRIVGFTVPANDKYKYCRVEIANGKITNEEEFEKAIAIKKVEAGNKIVATVPAFGKEYTWRVTYLKKAGKKKSNVKTTLFHFETMEIQLADTTKYRLKIEKPANTHKDMLVLLDYTSVMYDMKGNPVWFLPKVKNVTNRAIRFRDLKPTPFGTFTAVCEAGIFEFDYEGNTVWKGPDDGKISGDSSEHYHHEFTRLSNGHYMAAGNEKLFRAIPSFIDTVTMRKGTMMKKKDGQYYRKTECGTLIEYDTAGNIVWSWKSSAYLTDKDLFEERIHPDKNADSSIIKRFTRNSRAARLQNRQNGRERIMATGNGIQLGIRINPSSHMNAFYFDELNKCVYVSFRDLNRIIKIDYPSGKVVAEYDGAIINEEDSNYYFLGQHSCRINKAGQLYFFNNGKPTKERVRRTDFKSGIAVLDINKDGSYKKAWSFVIDGDSLSSLGVNNGGSVYELSDGAILTCMGAEGRVFIVDMDKNIIWNALPQVEKNGIWSRAPQYRASFIEHPDNLRKFIFKD